MPTNKFEFSAFGESFRDLDDFVDVFRNAVSSNVPQKSFCEMLGIEINNLSEVEKIALADKVNGLDFDGGFYRDNHHAEHPDILKALESNDLNKASCIFEILGYNELARKMRTIRMEIFVETSLKSLRQKAIEQRVISADRSKAKKGKTNRHQSDAIKIASLTWEKHPHASLAGMAQEIYSHLREKWNDVPVVGTIEKWLKESGLNPEVKPKNRDFKLVIIEGV